MGIEQSKEIKYWQTIKWIPGVNIIYGSVRAIVYWCKNNNQQALDSVIAIIGGLVGFLAGAGACSLISGFAFSGLKHWIIHYMAEMIAGCIGQSLIIGSGNIWMKTKYEKLKLADLSTTEFEKLIYDEIVKDVVLVGGIYSFVQALIHLMKNETEEASRRFCLCISNLIGSLIALLGASYISHKLPETLADDFGRAIAYCVQKFAPKLGTACGCVAKCGLEKHFQNAKYL